jgi:hypothetical protein
VPNVKKIRGFNLPGTPWANSACCGRPLPFYFYFSVFLKERELWGERQKSGGFKPVLPDKVKILDKRNCNTIYPVTGIEIPVFTV